MLSLPGKLWLPPYSRWAGNLASSEILGQSLPTTRGYLRSGLGKAVPTQPHPRSPMDCPCFLAIQLGPWHSYESVGVWVWSSVQQGPPSLWPRAPGAKLHSAPLFVLLGLCEHVSLPRFGGTLQVDPFTKVHPRGERCFRGIQGFEDLETGPGSLSPSFSR